MVRPAEVRFGCMPASYRPTQEVIREHVQFVEETACLPPWQRGESSLHLLLGLRMRSVDKRLAAIAPSLGTDVDSPASIGSEDLLELVAEPSITRITRLIERSVSALPLAWLTPSDVEALELVHQCSPILTQHRSIGGAISVLFASLCEIARRHNASNALQALKQLGTTNWLEHAALCRATNEPVGIPTLARTMFPDWLPHLPPAISRDPLTGLLSRSILYDDPHRYMLPTGRYLPARLPTPGVFLVDVDHMIRINDRYGFSAGDAVLQAIAERVHSLVGDRVIRYGGDEQLVFWDEADGDMEKVADAVLESVRALKIYCVDAPDGPISVTVSAGLAVGKDPVEVIHAAEDALVHAKASGRDRIFFNRS